MNNIMVDIKDDTVYCYKKDNSYTNQIINQHTNIIIDVCNIISQYVNCIIIGITRLQEHNSWRGTKYLYTINAIREFIDFKPFIHYTTVIHYKRTKFRLGYWAFYNGYNESTILNDNVCQYDYNVLNLDNYMKQYQKKEESIIIDSSNKEHRMTIHDHELFLCLMSIIYKIVNTYSIK